MRRAVTFCCEGSTLVGTLDQADGDAGLLIVSGGNEIRSGAHRGMAELAATVAAAGHPVFRFDRRGIGDSEGENHGFEASGPDIAAAIAAFGAACPRLSRVVAFGNCDAATALVLHATSVDARVLANPWVLEGVDDLPPPAAIRARYAGRLRDPKAWADLISGKIDFGKLFKGLRRVASAKAAAPESLADKVTGYLARSSIPTTIVLASGDNTAIAFADTWAGNEAIPVVTLDSASHSFATNEDFARLVGVLREVLHA